MRVTTWEYASNGRVAGNIRNNEEEQDMTPVTLDEFEAKAHANELNNTLTSEGVDQFWRCLARIITDYTDGGRSACCASFANITVGDAAASYSDKALFDCDGWRDLVAASAANTAGLYRSPLEYLFNYADGEAAQRLTRGLTAYGAVSPRENAGDMRVFAADNPETAARLAGQFIMHASDAGGVLLRGSALKVCQEAFTAKQEMHGAADGRRYGLTQYDTGALTRAADWWVGQAEQREDAGNTAGEAQARTAHAIVCSTLIERDALTTGNLSILIDTVALIGGQDMWDESADAPIPMCVNVTDGTGFTDSISTVEQLIDIASRHMAVP